MSNYEDKGPPKLKEYIPDEDSNTLPGETWFERTSYGKWLSRPCVGSSFAYGSGGYFVAFLSTFGWTSNFRKANVAGGCAFAVVTMSYSAVCTYRKIVHEDEMREIEMKKQQEKIRRREAIQAKIDDRKRRHDERRKLTEKEIQEK